jgi:N-acetylmuramoyl-L-alanine amidase
MNIKSIHFFVPLSIAILMGGNLRTLAMDNVLEIDESNPSKNSRSRGGKGTQLLLLHCVGLPDEWVFKSYTLLISEGGLGVSAHYYVSQESKKTYQLVSEENSAFHAGVSEWRGLAQKNEMRGLNDISIGIELQSPGYAQINGEEGYYPYRFGSYEEEQITQSIALSQQIMKRRDISAENVIWHSDASPLRLESGKPSLGKTDPGPKFPARRFAEQGIGVWPSSDRLEDSQLDTSLIGIQAGLKKWGYPYIEPTGVFDDPTKYVLTAHYMHYLPKEITWENYKYTKAGSIFDEIDDWNKFSDDKEMLAISLENLNKKNFEF